MCRSLAQPVVVPIIDNYIVNSANKVANKVNMVAPVLRRVNTIGIRFTKGTKTEALIDKIIDDKLGIPVHEIAGMADYGTKKHQIKVISSQMYDHLVARYVGYPIRLDRNTEFEVDDLSSYKDKVKITRVPFELSHDTLKSLLERYGQVDRLIMCMSRERRYKNVRIDQAIAFMSVDSPIPSSLWIAETQNYMFFNYTNQPQTCINCGSLEHKAFRCDVFRQTRPENRPNAVHIDIEDEPLDESMSGRQPAQNNVSSNASLSNDDDNNEDDEDDNDEEDDGNDSGNTSSVDTETDTEDNTHFEDQFSCPECDVKFTTVHGLEDHKKTHVKTYADRAKSPARNSQHTGISSSQPTRGSNYQQTSHTNDKKRAASASPNSKSHKKNKFTAVSQNYVFYKL